MTTSAYFSHPHLAGNLLVFAAEDDVWLGELDAAASGTARAWRLTADQAAASHPRLDPSGTRVAWTSARHGGMPEVHTVAVDGGPVQRLTHWGTRGTAVRGWLSETEVLAIGAPDLPSARHMHGYALPLDGPARKLPHGPLFDFATRPGGAALLGSIHTLEPAWWKRYHGGHGGKIWYSADGAEFHRILGEVGGNLVDPLWWGERVGFLSDHEGVGALYSADVDGSGLRRHTDHGPYYARHATSDGGRVVYQCAGDLYLLESPGAEPVRLNLRLSGARRGRDPFQVSAGAWLGGHDLDGSGRAFAAEVRGTVHYLPVQHGPARAVLAQPGVRARLPLMLPKTDEEAPEVVVCVSDSDGEDGIDLVAVDGSSTRRLLSGQLGRVSALAASPDGRTLAVAGEDCRLLLVDVAAGTAVELARSGNNAPEDLAFSPDSAYLAWSEQWLPEDESRHVKVARLADRLVAEATSERFDDHSPVFTRDGKYLAFLSVRTFDPAYDPHVFELGFLPGARPYLLTLAADTPSPFAPELGGRPVEPVKTAEDKPGAGPEEGRQERAKAEPVVVDFEGLAERVVPLPVEAGRYRGLRAVKDGLVWLEDTYDGQLGESLKDGDEPPKARLVRFDLKKRKSSTLVEELDGYRVSGTGERIAYRQGEKLMVTAVEAGDSEDALEVDLDRVRVLVDPGAEWRQMYLETWRLMRDNFWRADMGGLDWAAVRERYLPLVERLGTATELRDLLWELQGETGYSHAYVSPPAPASAAAAAAAVGRLGADLERGGDGLWRIARIVPGESSVGEGRSPLRAPGVGAGPGDVIVAVDGRPVDASSGPGAQLIGKADQPVELTLRKPDGTERRIPVVPLASEGTLRYHDLIRTRRAQVRELSGGRLGYLHVPDMVASGWAEFHRDLHTEIALDGLVFDLRDNGGGHTSQLVIEKLRREIIGWRLVRNQKVFSYPRDARRGPMVTVTDECAGSDGDIGTFAVKAYGLGPVVGMRTWGGVTGITGSRALVDGTSVTQPRRGNWFEGAEFSVEGYGVDPDVEVPITPQDWAAGRDPQLETAVRLALEALAKRPAKTPPRVPGVN